MAWWRWGGPDFYREGNRALSAPCTPIRYQYTWGSQRLALYIFTLNLIWVIGMTKPKTMKGFLGWNLNKIDVWLKFLDSFAAHLAGFCGSGCRFITSWISSSFRCVSPRIGRRRFMAIWKLSYDMYLVFVVFC